MNEKTDLRQRTKELALEVIRLYTRLPKSGAGAVLGHQVLRSGTSVGAHYREAYRAGSTAEFISKIEGGLQELDETSYWLELLSESGITPAESLKPLQNETNELIAIFAASAKTAKQRIK